MSIYQIGAAIHPITDPALGLGMFGYGDITQKTEGVETELYARAFTILDPDSTGLAAITVIDLLSCSQAVKVEVVNRLQQQYGRRYTLDNVLICGNHTHSAPDGFSHYYLYNVTGGGFDPHTFECIVSGIVASIQQAHKNMAPGKIYFARGTIDNCGSQRSAVAYNNNPEAERTYYGRDTDNEMQLLKFVRLDGDNHLALGALSWYPIHPTDRGQKNHFLSGDNKGDASRRFEQAMGTHPYARETFVAAFANTNCGDVSPNVDFGHLPDGVHDKEHMEHHGRQQYQKARELFDTAAYELSGSIDARYTHVDMPAVTGLPGAIGLSMFAGSTEDSISGTGLKEGIVEGDVEMGEEIFRTLTPIITPLLGVDTPTGKELPPAQREGHLPKPIVLVPGLGRPIPLTPNIQPLQLIKIGQLVLAAVPAEITTMAGRRLRNTILRELTPTGVIDCAVTAYANGYSQYITTREEYQKQHYEGASTLFGPGTLAAYEAAFRTLAQALKAQKQVPLGPPLDDLSKNLKLKKRVTIRNASDHAQEVEIFRADDIIMLVTLPKGEITLQQGQDLAWKMPADVNVVKVSLGDEILTGIRPDDMVIIAKSGQLYLTDYQPPPVPFSNQSTLQPTPVPEQTRPLPPRPLPPNTIRQPIKRKRSLFDRVKSAETLLFLTIFACTVFFSEIAYQTSNYTARLFLTEAIVDHGTFRLDAYEETVGVDAAIYEGHLYSNKPPGSSLLMLPQYILLGKPVKWAFNTLDINIAVRNQDYAVKDVVAGWLVQIFSLGLYSAVGFVAFYRILGLLGVRRRFLLSLFSFFGTLMFAYATIGNGEMYTVPLLLLGLYYLLRGYQPSRGSFDYLWAGFWYGMAFFVTTQILLVIGVTTLVILVTRRKIRPLLLFLLPVLLFVGLTLGYNWYVFGHPLNFPVTFWAQGNPEVVLFEWPTLPKLAEMLFLPWKGIFFYSPYLLLSLPGFYYLYRRLPGGKKYRQDVVFLLAGSFLAYFLFLFFNVGWFGGADFGFRYIVPALPFLAISAAVWVDQRPKNPLVWLMILWSVALCTFGAITDPEVPTGVSNPFLYYNGPLFLEQATNNVPNLLLDQLFNINNWLLRFSTTFLFFAALAAIIWRFRNIWKDE